MTDAKETWNWLLNKLLSQPIQRKQDDFPTRGLQVSLGKDGIGIRRTGLTHYYLQYNGSNAEFLTPAPWNRLCDNLKCIEQALQNYLQPGATFAVNWEHQKTKTPTVYTYESTLSKPHQLQLNPEPKSYVVFF